MSNSVVIDTQSEVASKYASLRKALESMERVAVAFSGGVDSSLLAYVAHDVLGSNALCVHIASALTGKREGAEAREFCSAFNIALEVVDADPLDDDAVAANPPNRCYLCKSTDFAAVLEVAQARGLAYVLDGSNLDDCKDYRPGMKALEELGVRSPLLECAFTKADIRTLSKEFGLPTWNKPSAACLASRLPYGERITREKLERIDAAENVLHTLGFTQCRVRTHGTIARIEVPPAQIEALLNSETRTTIAQSLKDLGYAYVTLDLLGYRVGSMNEVL